MAVYRAGGSWWVDIGFKKRRYRLRSPDNHRDGAVAYEHIVRHKLVRGEEVYLARDPRIREAQAEDMSFADFAKRWLEKYASSDLKPSTRATYEALLKRYLLPHFGKYTLRAITTGLIEDFRAARNALGREGLSPKTMNNALSVLHRILVEASEWNILEKVPRLKWCATSPTKFDWLKVDESQQLLSAMDEAPWRLMVLCALRTGMRFGELLGLRWEDIDFSRNWVHVRCNVVDGIEGTPKNNRYRQVPLSPDLRQGLLEIPRRADRVMVLSNGETPTRWPAVKSLHNACRRAGLRQIGWHTLRHTYATQLFRAGVDISVVQRLMGHQTLEMTMRYTHVGMDQMEAAIVQLLHVANGNLESGLRLNVNPTSIETQKRAPAPCQTYIAEAQLQ